MNMRHTVGVLVIAAIAGVAMAAPMTVPARAASNKSLVIPEDQKKLGTVYYAVKTPQNRGIKFSSEAANERFDGVATDVTGFAIAGPADNPGKLAAGAWRVAVKSIDTKITERNSHLLGKEWLNADANPDITFALKEVTDVKLTKEMQGAAKTYTGTLKGEMTINGTTKEVEIPNTTMIFVAANPAAEKTFKGDIIALRCKYEIKLADYGISNDHIKTSKKVAEVIKVDQDLILATVPPEEQPELKAPEAAKPAAPKAKPEQPKEAPKPEVKPVGG